MRSRLLALRGSAGISQRELSRLSGLAPPHVGAIESGDIESPSGKALALIATTLGCSLDWLVRGAGEPPTEEEVKAAVASARERLATTVTPESPVEGSAA